MAEPSDRYSTVSLVLHWGIAALVVAQVLLIATADAAPEGQGGQWVALHKSIGLSILLLTLARIGWRIANPAIPLPDAMPTWQRRLARANHVLFYVVLIALPLGGWAASSAGGREIAWFGLFNWPLLPLPQDRELAGTFMDMHRAGVKLLYVLIALHVIGALKHHFRDRDNILRRMLPFLPPRP